MAADNHLSGEQFGVKAPNLPPDDDFAPLSDDEAEELYGRWQNEQKKTIKGTRGGPRYGDENNPKPVEVKPDHYVPRAPPGYHKVPDPLGPPPAPKARPGRQARQPSPMATAKQLQRLARISKGKRL